MFDGVLEELSALGDTISVPIESDKLIPSMIVEKGKRFFTLEYEGQKYPCMPKVWTSWTDKILRPNITPEELAEHGLVDEETGRMKRWSTSTIRKFLEMTDIELSNQLVRHWWERHQTQQWNLIKYADTDVPNPIRYIGTDKYRLYKHVDFVHDILPGSFDDMVLRNHFITENHLVLRVTDPSPLSIEGSNSIYAGFQLMNSENGSSGILIKFLIFDLICSNGLMMVIDSNTLLSQKHMLFDITQFRHKVSETVKTLKELKTQSIDVINDLFNLDLSIAEIQAILKYYRKEYDASQTFVQQIIEDDPENGWELISSITRHAQEYQLDTRMNHETYAGALVHDIYDGKHLKYMETY